MAASTWPDRIASAMPDRIAMPNRIASISVSNAGALASAVSAGQSRRVRMGVSMRSGGV